jgi:hypothetical protein
MKYETRDHLSNLGRMMEKHGDAFHNGITPFKNTAHLKGMTKQIIQKYGYNPQLYNRKGFDYKVFPNRVYQVTPFGLLRCAIDAQGHPIPRYIGRDHGRKLSYHLYPVLPQATVDAFRKKTRTFPPQKRGNEDPEKGIDCRPENDNRTEGAKQ